MKQLSLIVCLFAVTGCEQKLSPIFTGLTSFAVELVTPGPDARGNAKNPVTPESVIVNITALDINDELFEEDLDVDVFMSFGGNKIGALTACGKDEDKIPLATIHLTQGVAQKQTIKLLRAYGPATLWVQEHVTSAAESDGEIVRAYGASPQIFFPYPLISQIQTPLSFTAPTASYCSAYEGKQVTFTRATGGGKLVVVSVFSGGYVVADTGAIFNQDSGVNLDAGTNLDANGGGFNNVYVFSFGRPDSYIIPGMVLGRVQGNFSKFVGFSELNFPYQETTDPQEVIPIPPPVVLTGIDIKNTVKLLALAAATVRMTAAVCPIDATDDQWKKYNEFTLDTGACGDAFNSFGVSLPAKTLGTFDPLASVGQTIQLTGMLQNNSGQNSVTTPPTPCNTNADCDKAGLTGKACVEKICRKGPYNFWRIVPRDASDIIVVQ